jgi:type II secretory pathway component PulJ
MSGSSRAVPRERLPQAGMTLLEILIAITIMVAMLVLAWTTISEAADAKRTFERIEADNQEVRTALAIVVKDLEAAYLSKNENEQASHRRTQFVVKGGGKVPEVRFSTLGHRVFWADANESAQTVISYLAMADAKDSSQTHWLRREQRRVSNELPDEEPAEYDILVHDIDEVKIELWDWRDEEWRDRWDTTAKDGESGRLPLRVRITVKRKLDDGGTFQLTTQARPLLQEQLNFVQ